MRFKYCHVFLKYENVRWRVLIPLMNRTLFMFFIPFFPNYFLGAFLFNTITFPVETRVDTLSFTNIKAFILLMNVRS